MREISIERRFIKQIKKAGGLCWKFTSPGTSGVPDRIVVLPGGRVYFVELKRDDGKLSEIQKTRIRELTVLGAGVFVVVGAAGIEEFLKYAGL